MKDTKKLTCPECGQQIDYETYNTINVTLNPELKDKVLSGEIFKVECPKCGHTEFAAYSLLYHDMDHKFVVQYTSKDERDNILNALKSNTKKTEEIIGETYKSYKVRVVDEFPAFVEKVKCLEANVDDRLLEILRIYVAQMLHDRKQMNDDDRIYLYKEDEGFKIDVVNHKEGTYKTFHIKNELYETLDKEFSSKLEIPEYDIDIIDFKWGFSFIEKIVKSLS